ncbi:MAG TPA: four helix bundle protein [Deltaproteobacteria bacterium]|nr:four helix bundle protein [Deltaproteobacteria bacterium]
MPKFNFENLDIYHNGLDFAERIYIITQQFPESEKFSLTNQLRRAATSIPSNIAEGMVSY